MADSIYKVDSKELRKVGVKVSTFTNAARETILDALGPALTEQWKYNAQQHLYTSRERYLKAIRKPTREKNSVLLRLRPGIATMVEDGYSSFDLRESLLTSDKSKVSKDGHLYFNVPFRIKVSSARAGEGSEFGTPAGVPYRKTHSEKITKQIGKRVTAALKSLPEGQRLGDGLSPQWERYKGGTTQSIYTGARREVKRSLDNRTNKRDVFKFVSYRTISEKNVNGWIHPGIAGKKLIPKTLERTDEIVQDIISGIAGQVFK